MRVSVCLRGFVLEQLLWTFLQGVLGGFRGVCV
jgi:hypothetical protein